MDNENGIRENVEKTLEMIDRLEPPKPGPYFYTRLEAELRRREKESYGRLPAKYGLARLRPALVTLLLLINVISAAFFLAGPKTIPADKTGTTGYKDYASVFLEDYSLKKNTYDIDVTEKMTGEEG